MATIFNFGKKTFVLKICSECWKSEILFFIKQPSTPHCLWKNIMARTPLKGVTWIPQWVNCPHFFTFRQSSISKTWRTLAEKDMLLLVYHICTLYKQALKHGAARRQRYLLWDKTSFVEEIEEEESRRREVEVVVEENQRCRKNSMDFYITNSGHCFLGPARIKHTTLRNSIRYI